MATPPPGPRPRRRAPIIAAILALLLIAGGAYAYFFTDLMDGSKVTIPNVAGKTLPDAQRMLSDAGLKSVRENEPSADFPEGQVVRSDPPIGTSVEEGSEVVLVVSLGPKDAAVPLVVGLSEEDAKRTLLDEDFNFDPKVVQEFSDKDVGIVIRQDPRAGTVIPQGEGVTIFVSKGPEPVKVPSLSLKSESEASGILEDAGLTLGDVTERETTKRPPGTIVGQDPAAGTTVPKGSSVSIIVAKEPAVQTISMPDVIGNQADAARQKLRNNGFADPIAQGADSDQPEGTVVGQDPQPGTRVDPANTNVVLFVSRGPNAPPATDTAPGAAIPGNP
jgi:serine/threonine-protein kinase